MNRKLSMSFDQVPGAHLLGAQLFQGPKPPPATANQVLIGILNVAFIVAGFWTVPLMLYSRNGEDLRGNIFVAAIVHGGIVVCIILVEGQMAASRVGQVTFFERGVTFGSGPDAVKTPYDELEKVCFVERAPRDGTGASALFGILIGNWTRVGRAYADSQYHWHVIAIPANASGYAVKIPDQETLERLKAVVPANKQTQQSV